MLVSIKILVKLSLRHEEELLAALDHVLGDGRHLIVFTHQVSILVAVKSIDENVRLRELLIIILSGVTFPGRERLVIVADEVVSLHEGAGVGGDLMHTFPIESHGALRLQFLHVSLSED